jgi:hypothetical protein
MRGSVFFAILVLHDSKSRKRTQIQMWICQFVRQEKKNREPSSAVQCKSKLAVLANSRSSSEKSTGNRRGKKKDREIEGEKRKRKEREVGIGVQKTNREENRMTKEAQKENRKQPSPTRPRRVSKRKSDDQGGAKRKQKTTIPHPSPSGVEAGARGEVRKQNCSTLRRATGPVAPLPPRAAVAAATPRPSTQAALRGPGWVAVTHRAQQGAQHASPLPVPSPMPPRRPNCGPPRKTPRAPPPPAT